MLYTCTRMATVSVQGLINLQSTLNNTDLMATFAIAKYFTLIVTK